MSDKRQPRHFDALLTCQRLPTAGAGIDGNPRFSTCSEVTLKNGDRCSVGQYVITQMPDGSGSTFVACVEEIVQQESSVASYNQQPDGILLQSVTLQRESAQYGMPHVDLLGLWSFVQLKVRNFFLSRLHVC